MEVLVSMGILMMGAAGIVRLHGTIIRGIASSRDVSIAMDVARQRTEDLGIIGAVALPNCSASVNEPGCVAAIGSSQYTAEIVKDPAFEEGEGYDCTRYVDSAQVRMATGEDVPAAEGSRFRVDTVVEDHPDGDQFPSGSLVTVSVCWMDIANFIRQVQVRRYVVPEA